MSLEYLDECKHLCNDLILYNSKYTRDLDGNLRLIEYVKKYDWIKKDKHFIYLLNLTRKQSIDIRVEKLIDYLYKKTTWRNYSESDTTTSENSSNTLYQVIKNIIEDSDDVAEIVANINNAGEMYRITKSELILQVLLMYIDDLNEIDDKFIEFLNYFDKSNLSIAVTKYCNIKNLNLNMVLNHLNTLLN